MDCCDQLVAEVHSGPGQRVHKLLPSLDVKRLLALIEALFFFLVHFIKLMIYLCVFFTDIGQFTFQVDIDGDLQKSVIVLLWATWICDRED